MNDVQRQVRELAIDVYKHGPDFVVRPPVTVASAGDTLRFYNLTNSAIVVFVPHREFKDVTLRVDAQQWGQLKVPSVDHRGVFPYAIYSDEARAFCKGGSAPDIIIEK